MFVIKNNLFIKILWSKNNIVIFNINVDKNEEN